MQKTEPDRTDRSMRLAFVFTNRGCNWCGMGQQLLQQEPVFRDMLGRCDRQVRRQLGWSLLEEFTRPPDTYRLHTSEEHQEPALTALQLCLSEVWRARGVRPDAVAGLCIGEFTAATFAGALSLEDTMDLACRISRVIRRRLGVGRMVSVKGSLDEAEALIQAAPQSVFFTAQYGPSMTILSCGTEDFDGVLQFLSDRGVEHQPIPSEFAFHSPLVDSWEEEFSRPLAGSGTFRPALPIYSALAGGRVDPSTLDARHWWQVVRRPVRRSTQVFERLLEDGYDTFVEIGAAPLLCGLIQETAAAAGKRVVTLPSMERDRPAMPVLDASLRTLGVRDDRRRAADTHDASRGDRS